MSAKNSVVNRQILIEDIFAELEALLLGAGKDYDDDEDFNDLIGENAKYAGLKEEYDAFPRAATEWSNLMPEEANPLKLKLLEYLEQKRLELTQSIADVDRIIAENAV